MSAFGHETQGSSEYSSAFAIDAASVADNNNDHDDDDHLSTINAFKLYDHQCPRTTIGFLIVSAIPVVQT